MPFPLAHPAAVLPLRRFCPNRLSFPGLLVGSIVPDSAYLLASIKLDEFSHSLWGIPLYAVPVGIILLGLLRAALSAAQRLAPKPVERALPAELLALGTPSVIVLSLLIGAATHLAWDSFTHKDGWLVVHSAFLREPLLEIAGRNARVCHLLWYGCSFVGIAWLYAAWTRGQLGCTRVRAVSEGALFACLVLPIQLLHHTFASLAADALVAGLTALLLLALFLRVAFSRVPANATPATNPNPANPVAHLK